MEIWELYEADGTLSGVEIERGEAIPDGLYFLAVEILVRHIDGDYLLMKRDERKPAFPGYYEASAGGAAQKGESPIEAAKRELYEETGIKSETLTEMGYLLYHKMLCYQYVSVNDCDKTAITLQEGETVDYRWVSEEEFIRFINSGNMIPTQRERYDTYLKQMGYIK